jgi:hypothetical protein
MKNGASGTPIELVTAFLSEFRVFPAEVVQAINRLDVNDVTAAA